MQEHLKNFHEASDNAPNGNKLEESGGAWVFECLLDNCENNLAFKSFPCREKLFERITEKSKMRVYAQY